MAQKQQGGQVQKSRRDLSVSRGSMPLDASLAGVAHTGIPPLRTISDNTDGKNSLGQSPEHLMRNDGAPTGVDKKTDKRRFETPEEKMADHQIKEALKRNGLSDDKTNV